MLQKTDTERKVIDVLKKDFNTYQPKTGDVIRVSKILNRFENRVKIEGTVFRPDTYSFFEGMRISDLIRKAEGLKEDAYKNRARLIRVKSDLTVEMLDVNLEKLLAGDKVYDLTLQKEDILTIYSLLDFKEYTFSFDNYEIIIDLKINELQNEVAADIKFYEKSINFDSRINKELDAMNSTMSQLKEALLRSNEDLMKIGKEQFDMVKNESMNLKNTEMENLMIQMLEYQTLNICFVLINS